MVSKQMLTCNSTEWETPLELFALLNREFGFNLDVCASESNRKCKRYFDKRADGLVQPWSGRCWMNPPYGRAIGKWVERAGLETWRDGGAELVVALVPARTDTRWWWKYVLCADEVRFLKGRVTFVGAVSGATFPSAIVVYRGTRDPRVMGGYPHVSWWDWKRC